MECSLKRVVLPMMALWHRVYPLECLKIRVSATECLLMKIVSTITPVWRKSSGVLVDRSICNRVSADEDSIDHYACVV